MNRDFKECLEKKIIAFPQGKNLFKKELRPEEMSL